MIDQAEIELTKRIKEGDTEAFKKFYTVFFKPVFSFVRGYVFSGEDARDIAQESFFALWSSREKLYPEKGCKSYVLRIARNNSINYLRKKKISREFEDSCKALDSEYMQNMFENDYWRKVAEYVAQLPVKQQEVFLLKKKNQLTNKQIAQKLNINVKTVEYRMMVALRILRKKVESLL
ncbi:MAG: RNA polymerase sigma-70 factor [Bacteroidales bacterium]|nr:RNA polymerase sigma-70 factor [Bacteroidales bacterium]MDD4669429.1 RNA polymerase sigma-70 factor [Bacteroidales bacterium]